MLTGGGVAPSVPSSSFAMVLLLLCVAYFVARADTWLFSILRWQLEKVGTVCKAEASFPTGWIEVYTS